MAALLGKFVAYYLFGMFFIWLIVRSKTKDNKLAWRKVTRSFWLQLLGFTIAAIISTIGKV